MTGLFVSGRSWRRSAGRGSIWGLVINRSNFPLCKTRALLGLIKDEYQGKIINLLTRLSPNPNPNPSLILILTLTRTES